MRELRNIVVASVVLVAVFAYQGPDIDAFILNLPASVLGIAAGFVLHELAHRFFSRRFHYHAEFVLWREGLFLAVVLALVSGGNFTFAAPGAVVISGRPDLWGSVQHPSRQKYGVIAAAGPVTNIVLAAAFWAAGAVYSSGLLLYAASINAWLALFNMIPMPPLDGSKVMAWDRRAWALVAGISLLLFFLLSRFA